MLKLKFEKRLLYHVTSLYLLRLKRERERESLYLKSFQINNNT